MSEYDTKSFKDVDPKDTGFLRIERKDRPYEPVEERTRHFREAVIPLSAQEVRDQATRCTDCGIPFCMAGADPTPASGGCPINNQIPDWNALVREGDWRAAYLALDSTNNFPEFTGRICPAPCEYSCTHYLTDNPVTIKTIECAIIDYAFEKGWVVPQVPKRRTGKRVAVIGSGPAGLACAQQLARAGHEPRVFEKNAKAGGLLRYGIPDFKMEKRLIDRRIRQMEAEGAVFHYNCEIGSNTPLDAILGYDAIVLAAGAEKARDLQIPGRELEGVHFAMDFLTQQNRRISFESHHAAPILATGKRVVIIGGGDTGSDCIGTSVRQGAESITQLEIDSRPPDKEDVALTWPHRPRKFTVSSSQAEGCTRDFSVSTQRFSSDGGRVQKLHCVRVGEKLRPLADTQFELDADLVLLAMGFESPLHAGMLEALHVALDARGNVKAETGNYRTSVPKIFAAGDMRRGQSLVVWAIREGRQAARAVDEFLMGETNLPR